MKLREHFDYTKYAEILHLSRFELAFCLGYFVLALIICFYSIPRGSLFSPDSTSYVLQAENIYLNHDFGTVDGAPVYPTLIAIIMGLGLTSEQSAGIIPIIFYSLLGFPLFLLGRTIGRPITGYLSCIVCLICGKYLLYVSTSAWTEMPYIFFTVVAILFITIFNRYGYVSSINIAGLFAFLATLTRYVGVAVIPVGIILIVINIKAFKKAITTIFNFSLIYIIPIVIWILIKKRNVYVFTTTPPIRSFSTTIHQFRVNLEQLFYNDYGLVAVIVMLFVIIAIIAIYLNKHLTSFAKDTIPLTGYITIYCIMMILLASSYGDYSLVNGLHLRYMIPIFPFMVLFVFSSFSDRYNSKSMYNTAYKVLPVILCALLVAQGSNALYSMATDIRTTSITDYSDRDRLISYLSYHNITALDNIYFEMSTNWPKYLMAIHMRNPNNHRREYYNDNYSNFLYNNIPGETIFDNLILYGSSTSVGTLAELIKKNRDLPTYIVVPYKVALIYIKNSAKDICLSNPYRFSNSIIFKASLPRNNASCNSNLAPEAHILGKNASIKIPLAGNFMVTNQMGQNYDQLLLLSSNLSEYNLQIMDFVKGSSSKFPYLERSGKTQLIADRSYTLLTGDFMDLGYEQALSIERHPRGDMIVIEDFSQGISPAIIRYSEVLSNNSTFRNLVDAENAQLAGDFLGRGHSQVLFIDRNPKKGKIVIADFSKGNPPDTAEFSQIEGNSTLLNMLMDNEDKQIAGDFVGLGHSQLLMINCNHTKPEEAQIMIIDFSLGGSSASVRYLEKWNKGHFREWLDDNDTQLAGDFLNLGHSQVLFINHNRIGGKILISDFSSGKPPASVKFWQNWDKGIIFQGWMGIDDTIIAGDFKGLGFSQVAFLNSSINGFNATIVDFINGDPMISF